MTYKALYRVYRPKTFNDVVGQKQIVTTLINQVKLSHISHAYLFCGSRGTGKTSIAKIFARAISCTDPKDGEPCGKCKSCVDCLNDNSIDVLEIDAASNNGVDEVREIREKVKFAPANGRYKVYIIDEVHMLTSGAFNALLKTLEEPPSHAVFILATTEAQKLPTTIISRCQRYNFERISNEDITKKLSDIAKDMEIEIEDAAIELIAKNSDGGLRDAISLFDQAHAFCGQNISKKDILYLLGSTDETNIFEIAEYIAGSNTGMLLTKVDYCLKNGSDVVTLAKDIINHFRTIMIIKTCKDYDKIIQLSDPSLYIANGEKIDMERCIRTIESLSSSLTEMRYSQTPRIILELALMEICTPEVSSDNSALLDRISKLENIIDHLMEVKPVSDYNEQKQQRAHTIDKQTTEKQANTAVNSFNDDDAPPFDMDEEDSHKKSATLIPMAEKPSAKITEVAIDTNKADEIDESDDSDIDISGNDGSEFTQKDYEKLLNKIKSVDKALFTLLFESTFESFRNGVLNIRFSEKNHIFAKALQNPANMEKTKIFINKSGFKTSNICVTIGKASATPANKLDVIYNVLDKDKIKIID